MRDTLLTRFRGREVPAPLLFVLGGGSQYLGAALAVMLFERFDPAVVAWLRMFVAALVLLAWRLSLARGRLARWRLARWRLARGRPDRTGWRADRLVLVGCFGMATGLMNIAFYEAIARLPLGTAVAVEFCGPVAVAALGSRSRRDVAALALAGTGVALIAEVRLAGSPAGVGLALLAATMWAVYIVLGKRVASGGNGLDEMTAGFVIAAALLSPLALGTGPVWRSPSLLVPAVGVGVLSTALPYALDQVVLRRVGQARFALLLALLPATASVVGLLLLAQVPLPREAVGIIAVVAAVALRARQGRDKAGGGQVGVMDGG